ncbi:MAG: DUF2147 domain-containing protein [Syntrophaceae bacterium]|jgi:uncharacterized protein (DUF2147 family)|nr:DUF2147 domain-containing protein [Syntrophaceae bacterium]HOC60762.1 DUF2147 domain-containing protein [Smithellaceae bacterium]HQM46282.1 DUF2147 domain-containing protein [Smithellaceae bacterium]
MKTKLGFLLGIIAVAFFAASSVWAADPIVGKWNTIDDETKQVKSIVEIYMNGGKAYGVVRQLTRPQDKGKLCTKCEGADKGKPIEGMIIVKNMSDSGSEWEGGTILDPSKGKEYKCKIKAVDGGSKLHVKGCISILCRTQEWVKAN